MREIDLIDLMRKLLLKWRFFLTALIVGIVAMFFLPHMNEALTLKRVIVIVLGFMVGAVIFCCIAYLIESNIRVCDNIGELYNIELLGSMSKPSNAKEKGLDKWINKHLTRGYRERFNYTEDAELLALWVNPSKLLKEGRELLLVSSLEESTDLMSALYDSLRGKGLAVTTAYGFMKNKAALEQVTHENTAVVVIEAAEESSYEAVQNEVKLLKRIGCPILGGIFLM